MAITTVTKALRKLYKNVTGEDTKKISPTKIINDLADNWPGGGGGSSTLICELIQEGNSGHLDKTFGEIKDAVSGGNQVFVRGVSTRGDVVIIPFAHFSAGPGGGGVIQFIVNEFVFSASSDSDYPSMGGSSDSDHPSVGGES